MLPRWLPSRRAWVVLNGGGRWPVYDMTVRTVTRRRYAATAVRCRICTRATSASLVARCACSELRVLDGALRH